MQHDIEEKAAIVHIVSALIICGLFVLVAYGFGNLLLGASQ